VERDVDINDVSRNRLESYFKDAKCNKNYENFIATINKDTKDMELFIHSLNQSQRSRLFISLVHHLKPE
jgi:hypothetical protein